MKPSEALRSHREEIRRVVELNRARNPRVFGSVLHGADIDGSDLDLIVDPLPGATLFDMGVSSRVWKNCWVYRSTCSRPRIFLQSTANEFSGKLCQYECRSRWQSSC